MTSPDPLSPPTRVRYGVLAFACVLSMVTYLDRVSIGIVAGNIESEFGLTNSQMGVLFGAFVLAYSLFEVPSGWLGDVFGPKRTLIRIVLWWSFFTALTGLIRPFSVDLGPFVFTGFAALLVVRFLFGAGEAGAYPNISRSFHNWFPFGERGSAQGAVWMAGRFGGGITPLVVGSLIFFVQLPDGSIVEHWRHIFWILGGLGATWCAGFWWWFRDRPDQPSAGTMPSESSRKAPSPLWRPVGTSGRRPGSPTSAALASPSLMITHLPGTPPRLQRAAAHPTPTSPGAGC